jgi:hypothetical protein
MGAKRKNGKLKRGSGVATAILAAVEPGFQPGGIGVHSDNPCLNCKGCLSSGQLEAALYGRQGCLPLQSVQNRAGIVMARRAALG